MGERGRDIALNTVYLRGTKDFTCQSCRLKTKFSKKKIPERRRGAMKGNFRFISTSLFEVVSTHVFSRSFNVSFLRFLSINQVCVVCIL